MLKADEGQAGCLYSTSIVRCYSFCFIWNRVLELLLAALFFCQLRGGEVLARLFDSGNKWETVPLRRLDGKIHDAGFCVMAECGKVVGCVVMLGVAFVAAEGVAPGATSGEVSGAAFGVLLGVGVAAGVGVEAGVRVLDGAA